MQTVEFNVTIKNGIIPIPKAYISKIPRRVKVTLTEDVSAPVKKINFDELTLDTTGFEFSREEANDW